MPRVSGSTVAMAHGGAIGALRASVRVSTGPRAPATMSVNEYASGRATEVSFAVVGDDVGVDVVLVALGRGSLVRLLVATTATAVIAATSTTAAAITAAR